MGTYDGEAKHLLARLRAKGSLAPLAIAGLVAFLLFATLHHEIGKMNRTLEQLSSSMGVQRSTGRLKHHGRKYNVDSVKNDLRALFKTNPCMPLMLRLAWHDAGTFSKWDNSGGPNGSIRFPPERDHPANAGLRKAMDILEPIKEANPSITYADLYQLAGYVAVEYAGGPRIDFRPGRPDAYPSEVTADGRLPDGTKGKEHLRDIFYRMGFTDREVVALSGAHTLGRAHKDRSGFVGAWTDDPQRFENDYFKMLVSGGKDGLLLLESDRALLRSREMRDWVQVYADDQVKFFQDYAAAHKKLSELGVDFEL